VYHEVIQRELGRLFTSIRPLYRRLQRRPFVKGALSGKYAIQSPFQSVFRDACEESESPQIHAEHRHACGGEESRTAEKRAVASKRKEKVRRIVRIEEFSSSRKWKEMFLECEYNRVLRAVRLHRGNYGVERLRSTSTDRPKAPDPHTL